MFLAKLSINRPVMMTMFIVVFLIFGGLSFMGLNLNQTPDVKIPFVVINTVYPGAGPKEVETQVTKKIEDVISTVSKIKKIESYSMESVSIIVMEFELDKDVDVANQEVKSKVDQILNELPDDAELPITQKFDIAQQPIVDVILSGNLEPTELYEFADKELKDRFSQIGGVAKVDIIGGQEREIKIQMKNREVYENAISLPQMMQILAAYNMDMPGGYFKIRDQEFTVRLEGEFPNLETIREIQVPTAYGPKKIRQFARVVDGGKKIRQKAIYFDNATKKRDENVVRLSIVKSTEGNAVEVADAVKKAMPEIKVSLPQGTKLEIVNDMSEFTKATVEDTMSNIILGIIFTSIILLLFLHDIRSTIIVALSMPISIISTFLLMDAAGLTLNVMSLMGISVSVGVLVSNSVIVIENIFRFKGMGENNKQSAYKGTSEVTVAVLAATMTNIVVFVPLANIFSIPGQFLKELALTATFSTIFSLIMSFTLTPMLASLILPKEQKFGAFSRAINKFEKIWDKLYESSLKVTLKNKWISALIVAVAFVLFFIVMITVGPKLGTEFMPVSDNGRIQVQLELPSGYNLDATEDALKEVESRIAEYDIVTHMVTNLGKVSDMETGTNLALMEVYLTDANEREIGVVDMVQKLIKDLSTVPNAKIMVSVMQNMGGGGSPIEFFLQGQDIDSLDVYKNELFQKVSKIDGLVNLSQSSKAGKPELSIYPKRKSMVDAGVSVQELAITLRSAIEGIVTTQYRDKGEEYDMVVTLDENATNTPEKVSNIAVTTPTGIYRLSELADVVFTTGYSSVLHRDKYTAIKFTASNAPDVPTGNLISEIDKIANELDLPPGYRIRWSGQSEMEQQMIADLAFSFMLAIILTYMLLAAILESFWQPVIILMTMPLALIGVLLIMFITGTNFGITAMMGVIMLIGIVVNNAILILDYTNQLVRDEGLLPRDALIKAAPTKLKPITMATLAIILGMLPMALGVGSAGSEIRMPLGVVSIGGLIASTLLALWVIPSFYFLFSRTKHKEQSEKV